jgi:hypothetical protein
MAPNQASLTPSVYSDLLERFKATPAEQLTQRWLLLESAHVVGQTRFGTHLQVHVMMLGLAWETRSLPEACGQLFRIMLVPLGHLFGRLPIGNSGRSNVSAFQPMQPSPEILKTISQSRRKDA